MLASAERTFPVLDPIPVLDAHPLARPPWLGAVPSPTVESGRGTAWGVSASALGLVAGLAVLWSGRRRRHA